jgi:uncharacterized protein (TIGR00369 family)
VIAASHDRERRGILTAFRHGGRVMNEKKVDIALTQQAFDHALETHEQVFENFFLARLLGFEVSYEDDACTVAFDIKDFMFNPQGSVHGGIIALAMDVSMGHLLKKKQGAATTLEMKVQYLRPVLAGRVRATGRFLRQGRSASFLESRMLDESEKVLAVATATWMPISLKS